MLEQVSEFVCLGCAFSRDERYTADIERRVNLGNNFHLFRSLQNSLGSVRLTSREDCQNHLSQFFDQKPQNFYSNGITSFTYEMAKMTETSEKNSKKMLRLKPFKRTFIMSARYPDLVQLVHAGFSFEGRQIKYLKISTTNFNNITKPIYFMNAMIHAREWVTTPVTIYSVFRLVENLRSEDRDLLQDVDWIILPIVNPDGYEYSHTDFRLWRRTRSVNLTNSVDCVGVDGNRNFDVSFNTVGVSSNPCSDVYPGPEAFSEPETRIVRDILLEYLDRIQLYLDIHSHGNYVLFGFGNQTVPSNAAQVHHVGAAMGAVIDTMKLPEAGYYLVGNSASVLYGSSGSAQDYGQVREIYSNRFIKYFRVTIAI
ncbi:hypothetical protein K1T71_011036 [Dendrolimus kikuchii]|uniref:Uncharacterized protein n=1 Tax=Dendrolimus kikuchii TaxID=765133 RepID=A0ACC1CMQ1_9NEOP|nr:hypothetical protein K1T71_011036 [Dendrolimus kikuchii]